LARLEGWGDWGAVAGVRLTGARATGKSYLSPLPAGERGVKQVM
jgi:hypothetical protein